MKLTKSNILKTVANQRAGYKFGKPQRIMENGLSVVLPITRKTAVHRLYITYPEANLIVTDTGLIEKVNVKNNTDQNVFIRSGTIFEGKTQERTLVRSAVILPGEERSLEVRCVHASKGIQAGSSMNAKSFTPLSFAQQVHPTSSQSVYWNAVSETMTSYTVAASNAIGTSTPEIDLPYDDLATGVQKFSKHFEEILSKVKAVENQVGIAMLTDQGCEIIEFFDVPLSWQAIHEAAIRHLGTDLVKEDKEGVFEYKPEKAVTRVQQVLSLAYDMKTIYKHHSSDGEAKVEITALTSENYMGEVVEIDGKVMHVWLIRKEIAGA